jgi:hypothetical protein
VFVLAADLTFAGIEYYAGKTYIFQGEYYPVLCNRVEEAKQYTLRGRADNACIKLSKKVGRTFKVVEV